MKNNAFTLIEVLIAVLLVGVAIASLVGAGITSTKANAAGVELATAEFLIQQIHELTILLPVIDVETLTDTFGSETGETLATYDDLDDFDGQTFSPPINVQRQSVTDLANYSQIVTVENVSAGDFELSVGDHSSLFVRVTVEILLNSKNITSASWIRARY